MNVNRSAPISAGENIFRVDHPRRFGGWRKRLVMVLSALLLLFAGGAIGASLTLVRLRGVDPDYGGMSEQICQAITSRVSESVPLTQGEKSELERIVKEDVSEMQDIRRRYEAEARRRLAGMHGRLCAILGPERSDQCGDWLRKFGGDAEGMIEATGHPPS